MLAIDLAKTQEMDFPAIVKLTALQLLHTNQPYTKPGEWLQGLSNYDLFHLIMMADDLSDQPDDPITGAFVALTMILMQAEGVPFESGDLRPKMVLLINMIAMEQLRRKQLIDISYNNLSFGDDAGHLEIARLKKQPTDEAGEQQ